MSAVRTSGRQRKPPAKYSIDAFEGLGLSSDSDSEESPSTRQRKKYVPDDDDDDEDEEFTEGDAIAAEEMEVDDAEDADDIDEDASNTGSDEGANNDDSGNSDIGSLVEVAPPKAKPTKRLTAEFDIAKLPELPAFVKRVAKAAPEVDQHSRGLPDISHRNSMSDHVLYTFGPAHEDLEAYLKIKPRWFDQMTLPTRHTATVKGHKTGGIGLDPLHSADQRSKESASLTEWLNVNGGQDGFDAGQQSTNTDGAQTAPERAHGGRLQFLGGPVDNPSFFNISPGGHLSLRTIWRQDQSSSTSKGKDGWVLNPGGKLRCIKWSFNQSGLRQYLGMAIQHAKPSDPKLTMENAFVPHEPYRSTMQLWEFGVSRDRTVGARPDMTKLPILRAVFSWDWGDLRTFRWCPISPDKSKSEPASDYICIGILAGIWTDGKLRILNITIKADDSAETQYIHIEKAAFEVRPPDTVCTSLAWLSWRSIAAGCANGHVAVWDITNVIKTGSPRLPSNPRPFFYHQLHESFVISIDSCWPSRPHQLLSHGFEGLIRLTDLRSPHADRIESQRQRVALPSTLWYDQYQMALSSDESCQLHAGILRRFWSSPMLAKVSALITDIAVSPLHPGVLTSCVDGTVWGNNPFRKLRNHKVETYCQLWFKHEWRGPMGQTDQEDAARSDNTNGTTQNSANPNEHLTEPLSRFTEGYKLVKAGLVSTKKVEKDQTIFTTIYEEMAAVTKVVWNPNLICGTWAAAAMANGLVRVEDIGLD